MNKYMCVSSEKNEVRKVIMDLAEELECKHWLGMASEFGVDAKMFASRFRTSRLVSVESKEKVFKRQIKELSEFRNITCLHTTMSEFLDKGIGMFPSFDCVFLDYNGIYSTTIEDDMVSLFSNGRFTRNGVFALTIAKGREREEMVKMKNTRLIQSVCCGNLHDYLSNRENAITTTLHSICKDLSIELKPVFQKSYTNNKGGMAMMAFVFKVVNRILLR